MPKWLVVARNEYRIRTSSIRGIRPYLPPIVIGLLAVYVAFIAPTVVNMFIDDFLAFILSQVAVAMVQVILFMIFIYFMIIPITETLRETQVGQLEIFLAAPIKPSDVLLGEFMGVVPLYTIAVTVIAGFFTAALSPLGLDMIQIAIIIMVFVVTFFSALWIGTVIAAVLRTKLGQVARGRDIGRALSVIIVLPTIALMYAIMGGGLLEALADPGTSGTVKAVLGLLPSSWGAEVIIGFANNPGNIAAVSFETLTRFGGLLAFFGATLWLGAKAANRVYSLETTSFTAARAKPDGFFYKSIKYLGGRGSFGTLLVSVFKDYSRRLENLSWLVYTVGLMALLSIFFGDPSSDPEDPLTFMSEMMIPMLAAFVVGTVNRGKAALFTFKRSPSGIGKLVKARLLQAWLVTIPIVAVAITVSTVLVPQVTSISLLINIAWGSLRSLANVIFILGLALMIPSFSEKSRERSISIVINLMVAVFTSIGLEIGFSRLGLGFKMMFPDLNTYTGMLYDHLLHTTLISLAGIMLLSLGKRKLSRIE